MNKKLINTLIAIVNCTLIISGIIFLCLSIFTETKDNTYLIIALISTLIANLINVIRTALLKKDNKYIKKII